MSTYLCFCLREQTGDVCQCLEGKMDLIPYIRTKQEAWGVGFCFERKFLFWLEEEKFGSGIRLICLSGAGTSHAEATNAMRWRSLGDK